VSTIWRNNVAVASSCGELALHAAVVARAAVSAARATLRTLRSRRADGGAYPGAALQMLRDAIGVLAAGCPNPSSAPPG